MRLRPGSIHLALAGLLACAVGGFEPAFAEKPVKRTDPPAASMRAPVFVPARERAPDENVPAAEKAAIAEAEGKTAVAGGGFEYYYVAGAELVPRDTAGTTKDYTGTGCSFVVAGTDRIMNTGLHLPEGAIIKYLRIFYNDTSVADDVLGYITRYDTGTSTDDLISVSSTGSGGFGTMLSTEITHVVDNFGFAYVLIGWPDAIGTATQVCGLRVAYYPPAGQGHFHKVTPCRVFDTRAVSSQTTGNPLPNPGPHNFRIQGNCGIPDGAQAAVINATVVSPTQLGDLRLFPAGGPQPVVSTLNYTAGTAALANGAVLPLATVAVPADKDLSVVIGMVAAGTVHLIIDVTGYYD